MPGFSRPVTFASIDGSRSEQAEAVIDTGSEYCLVPSDLAGRIGVVDLGVQEVGLADGSLRELRLAAVRVQMQGRTRVVTAVIGPPGVEPLIGANTLGQFSFGVDPQGERLIPQIPRLLASTNWPTW